MIDATLTQLLDNYQPNPESSQLLRDTKVVLLVGITGAGKNTILSKLLETGRFHDIVTSVTREPRMNNGVMEQDGVDYHFLSYEQAVEKIKQGQYIEVSPVHKRIYGVTVDEIQKAHNIDKTAIADITVLGVEKFKKISDDVIPIFILPPNFEDWQKRVKMRFDTEQDFLKDWPNRRESAIMELEKALSAPYYHYVINDEIDSAVSACLSIIDNNNNFHPDNVKIRQVAHELLQDIQQND